MTGTETYRNMYTSIVQWLYSVHASGITISIELYTMIHTHSAESMHNVIRS
jgi:hypothetical protein